MANFMNKNDRLNNWNDKKKNLENRRNINLRNNGKPLFTIKPWSIWWFNIGENVGTETSSHYDPSDITYISHKRPCLIISTRTFNGTGSFNKKVIVMPLTSLKPTTRIRPFHYKLEHVKYGNCTNLQTKREYNGLGKDSLVICNEIKTIDTKRLTSQLVDVINEEDKLNIQNYIKKYLSIH